MHPILRRQLRTLNLLEGTPPADVAAWAAFLAALDRSFAQFDTDRQFQERSMAIASEEMAQLHTSLAEHNNSLERQVQERTEQLKEALQEAQRINSDLTIAKRAAEAANLAKSEFLAHMSHEIRTPLTSILGFTDILRDDAPTNASPDQRKNALEVIHSTGQHLLSVISDILDLSMVESGRLAFERKETNLPELLAEINACAGPRAIGKGLQLQIRLASPIPQRIISDPTRLRQILMKLLCNAMKFTETGEISVTVLRRIQDDGQRLVIDVEDTGCGIIPEQQARLFQPFTQGDSSMTRAHGGTGLGLVIARRLANLVGGDVKLVHTTPRVGSCFRIDLPLEPVGDAILVDELPRPARPDDGVCAIPAAAPTPAPVALSTATAKPDAPQPAPPGPLKGRLLLVDDTSHIRDIVGLYFRRAGADVDTAENGQIALNMINQALRDGNPYKLMVTDMQMPIMDGYTLARTLRERGSTLAIVALTAHAMTTESAKCFAAGCDAYASKPVDKAALIKTCAEWMGRPSPKGKSAA